MSLSWETHYGRGKARLSYPDENLVRMLCRALREREKHSRLSALDLGCGSGRHMKLLSECGLEDITGLDPSTSALNICSGMGFRKLVLGKADMLPFRDDSFDIIIAWGSLHYGYKSELPASCAEIKRVLKSGGLLLATLRSFRDTCAREGKDLGDGQWCTSLKDIEGTVISFYSENELKESFKSFNDFDYGIMERSMLGDTGRIISHWFFKAVK